MSDAKDSRFWKHGCWPPIYEMINASRGENNRLFFSVLSGTVQNFESLSVSLDEAGTASASQDATFTLNPP